MSQITLDLKQIPFMSDLDTPTLIAIREIARLHHLMPREFLFHQGDLASAVYIIQKGGVRLVEYTSDGQVVNHKVYGQYDIFGMLAVSGAYPHPASIEAIDESWIICLPGESARRVMGEYPQFALLLIDLMVKHIHHAHDRLRQMAAERVEQRIARALLHYHRKFGVIENGEHVIDVTLSQQDIAEFTATSVESVNRTLRAWHRQGIVACSRQHVDILDAAALSQIAQPDNNSM